MSDEQLDAAIAQHQQTSAQSAPSDFSHLSDEELDQQIAAHQQAPETQPDAPRTWGNTAVDYGKELATGVGNLSRMAGMVTNPLGSIADRITGSLSQDDIADASRQRLIGNPEYKGAGALERIGGATVRAAPLAAVPGGGLMGAISALSSGAGGQTAKELGYPELAGELVGGMGPGLMFGGAKALVQPLSTEEEAIRKLGVKFSALKKAEKYGKSGALDEPNLEQAVAGARERGLFSGKTDAGSLLEKNQSKISSAHKEMDDLVAQAKAKSSKPIEPDFSNAKEFLKKKKSEEGLEEAFNAKKDRLSKVTKGDLEELQLQKTELANEGTKGSNSTTIPKLYRVMAHDLKQSVKKHIKETLGEDAAERYDELNQIQRDHLSLEPVLSDLKLKDSAERLAPSKHGLAKAIDVLKNLGSAAGASAAVHYSAPGVNPLLGAALYGGAHLGSAALNSRLSKWALRGVVGNSSSPLRDALLKGAIGTDENLIASSRSSAPKSESPLPPALLSSIDQSSSSPMIKALASNSTPKLNTERDISTEGLSKKRALALVKALKESKNKELLNALAMSDAGGVGVYDDGR